MRAGKCPNNPDLVSLYTENAPLIEVASTEWWDKAEDEFAQAMMPDTLSASSFVNRHTGRAIQMGVRLEVLRQGVKVFEDTMVIDLLKYQDQWRVALLRPHTTGLFFC